MPQKALEWRGIDCNVEGVSIGDKLEASKYDLFFIGGGQDFEQGVLLQDLSGEKTAEIKAAIEDEKVFLAICGGYQILGSYYKTWDGQQCDFLGALDLYTVGQKDRMIGNYMYECDDLGGQTVVGFENHSGQTFLGDGVKPIGKVLSGYGNNGKDGYEGARYKNVYATYSHGCLLPKNPAIADMLIRWALERKYPGLPAGASGGYAGKPRAHLYGGTTACSTESLKTVRCSMSWAFSGSLAGQRN